MFWALKESSFPTPSLLGPESRPLRFMTFPCLLLRPLPLALVGASSLFRLFSCSCYTLELKELKFSGPGGPPGFSSLGVVEPSGTPACVTPSPIL